MVKDENYEKLEQIINLIVTTFLAKGVTTEKELPRHLTYDEATKMWKLDQIHITMMRPANRNGVMDA